MLKARPRLWAKVLPIKQILRESWKGLDESVDWTGWIVNSCTQCYSSENIMVTFQNLSTRNSEISCEHRNVYKKRCGSKSQTPEKCIPASEISSVVWICSSYHTWLVFLSLSVFYPPFAQPCCCLCVTLLSLVPFFCLFLSLRIFLSLW